MPIRIAPLAAAALLALPAIASPQTPPLSRPASTRPTNASTAGTSASLDEAEVSALLNKLGDPTTRKVAADRLALAGPESLTRLFLALEGETSEPAVRTQLMLILPKVYQRLNAQRTKANVDARAAWLKSSLTKYQTSGKRNPKWDNFVSAAMTLFIQAKASESQWRSAINAGCDDPLVRFFYAQRTVAPADVQQETKDLDAAVRDIDASAYSPGFKDFANLTLARVTLQDPGNFGISKERIRQALSRSLELYPDLVKEKPGWRIMSSSAHSFMEVARKTEESEGGARKIVLPVLEDAIPNSATFYNVSARSDVLWAWDARGGGYANTVTESGAKLFDERLDQVEQDVNAGWEADPCDTESANMMISVCMGKSYSRPVMEKWYTRAMLADPNDREVCNAKMLFLTPKWGGSPEELLAFGRECVQSGTSANRIPMILLDSHIELAAESGNPTDYWTQPGVWKDVQSIFKKMLADKTRMQTDKPNLLFDRALYIKAAIDCQQWKDALQLMNEFGDDINMKTLGGQAMYDYNRKKATEEAAK